MATSIYWKNDHVNIINMPFAVFFRTIYSVLEPGLGSGTSTYMHG